MKISETLKRILSKCENEIDSYQFENVYSELKNGKDAATFTEMMLSIGVDPAEHLGYIPLGYLRETAVERYNIPDSVTSIEGYAFAHCSRLTSVTIGNSVKSIGDHAFYYCSSLTSVAIPDSVTSIGRWAFEECSGLTSATIGNGVTNIGIYAFNNCRGLTNVTIPNSVTSIGDRAFLSCRGLTSVTIPDSVTNIGNNVFYGCDEMKDIIYRGTVKQWKEIKKREEDFSEIKIHCSDGDVE